LTIQIDEAALAFRSRAMVGSATLAIDPSRTVIDMASQIAATDQ